ncbi:MAG: PilZ domain-containing protein [Thermodesulfovibrionales bacterium]
MPRDIYDKRRHRRHLFFHKIEYCSGPCSPGDTCHGSVINISESGMCMYTDRRHDEGEDIEILNAFPVPYQKATIRWVVKYFHDLYKIGLAFIDQYAIP